jgi:hypothetical protein
VASITTSSLAAPTTSITTVYTGATTVDPSFTPSTSVTVLTVSAKPATAITLTATGAFTGSVAFTDTQGATVTTLATIPVSASGVAAFTTTTLAAGTHSINAAYSNDLVYSSVATTTSIKVVVTAPAYSVSPSAYGIAVQSGETGVVPITVSTVGGYSGSITGSCGSGLPSGVTCIFNPSPLVFSGGNNTQTTTLYISTSYETASLKAAPSQRSPTIFAAMLLWLPASFAGMLGLRRRKTLRRWQKLLLFAVLIGSSAAGLGSLTGCSGTQHTAPLGTFNVPVTITDGTTSNSFAITVSVLGNSSVN